MMGHMATFRLTRCHLRDGWLVPTKNEAQLTLDWEGLCAKLAPSKSASGKKALRAGVRVSSFVGLVRQPNGSVTNFVIRNSDMSGDVRIIVRRDPSFAQRLVDAYRIDFAEWDTSFIEATSSR